MSRRRNGEAGFRLIELLVVIVIRGILAAIVVFSVAGITDKGDKSSCRASVKTVEVAQEAYRAKNPGYAADIPALVTAGLLRNTAAADAASKGIATSTSGDVTHTCSF